MVSVAMDENDGRHRAECVCCIAVVDRCNVSRRMARKHPALIQNCSHGNFQSDVRAFTSRLVRTFPVTSALRFVLGIETEMHQSIVALARLHDHVATLATISARRPAPRHILLPPESNTTITAIPSLHPDFRFINKQSRYSPNPRDNPRGNGHPARLSRAKRGAPPPHAMRPRTPAL